MEVIGVAVAQFGNLPPIRLKHPLAFFYFRQLKRCYESLPPEVKTLFSFNTREVAYCPPGISSIFRPDSKAFVDYDLKKEKALIVMQIVGQENEDVLSTLIHELGHTLDPFNPYDNPCHTVLVSKNHFPDWLRDSVKRSEWLRILKKEPKSTELFNNSDTSLTNWALSHWEQWACRLAATLAVDYMIPAGLMRPDNVTTLGCLSEREFKSNWPLSYQFFHKYIQTILAHAPSNLPQISHLPS